MKFCVQIIKWTESSPHLNHSWILAKLQMDTLLIPKIEISIYKIGFSIWHRLPWVTNLIRLKIIFQSEFQSVMIAVSDESKRIENQSIVRLKSLNLQSFERSIYLLDWNLSILIPKIEISIYKKSFNLWQRLSYSIYL